MHLGKCCIVQIAMLLMSVWVKGSLAYPCVLGECRRTVPVLQGRTCPAFHLPNDGLLALNCVWDGCMHLTKQSHRCLLGEL